MTHHDDEQTPPRAGASYSLVEVGELAKRSADNSHETRGVVYEVKGVVMRHDAELAELIPLVKAAIVPQGRTLRLSAMIGAGALVVMAIAAVASVVRAQPSRPSVTQETAHR